MNLILLIFSVALAQTPVGTPQPLRTPVPQNPAAKPNPTAVQKKLAPATTMVPPKTVVPPAVRVAQPQPQPQPPPKTQSQTQLRPTPATLPARSSPMPSAAAQQKPQVAIPATVGARPAPVPQSASTLNAPVPAPAPLTIAPQKPATEATIPSQTIPAGQLKAPSAHVAKTGLKKTLMFEYHTWFENLVFSPTGGGAVKNVETVYYGFAFMYDATKYYTDWGWGGNAGLGQGFAVATGESSSYSQRRLPWTYLRAGGRIFRRMNGRMDLGLNLLVTKNSISFPSTGGLITPGPNPFFSMFLELRWRMNRQWEIIQALGNSTNNAGANMRIGVGNTF